MQLPDDIQNTVDLRFVKNSNEHKKTKNCIRKGETWKADTPDRLIKRLTRLKDKGILDTSKYDKLIEDLQNFQLSLMPDEDKQVLEAQIGTWDALPGWVLTRGAEMRRTVGIVRVHDGIRPGLKGTGFLVAPNLLLTNQHVFTDFASRTSPNDSFMFAKNSWVDFDYEETFQGGFLPSTSYRFRPDILFLCSPAREGLDYALVAVETKTHESSIRKDVLLSEFGYNQLDRATGKVLEGEPINIVHHPEGQPRHVSLQNNRLLAILDNWLHYETDTKSGSSGAPLYNRYWEVVGLHHAESRTRDAQGRPVANEGIRISKVVEDIERQKNAAQPDPGGCLTAEGHQLLIKMLRPPSMNNLPPAPVSPSVSVPPSTVPVSLSAGRRPISRPD
jgi:endonuclease G, mitochondrial